MFNPRKANTPHPWHPGTIARVDTEVQPVPGYFVTITRYEARFPGFPTMHFRSHEAAERWLVDIKELVESFRSIEAGEVWVVR